VSFEVTPKAGATARPVRASFTIDYLRRKGYAAAGDGLTLPLFGLYAGHTNSVSIEIVFSDGSRKVLPFSVVAAAYVDPFKIYDRPQIVKARAPGALLGFDYFFMKSGLGPPVIVDSDAEIRWAGVGVQASATSILLDNGFVMIDGDLNLQRLELDGSAVSTLGKIQSSTYVSASHNIDPGKAGILVEPDAVIDGQPAIESILAEVDLQGNVLSEWNFADILSKYMTQAGDDPGLLVRPGIDWFHMNSALYDPRDDSLIVSSRENFVIKVDYKSKEVKWIFGDPTKFWNTIPSLRAKALTLTNAGQYPDGQHSVSFGPTGDLVLFDNGQPASFPLPGTNGGELRAFSSVASYAINEASGTAIQSWAFDHSGSIKAPFCSSVHQTNDGSTLIDYATADNFTHARLVGLDAQRTVVFDFQYDTTPCATGWNAQVIPLHAMAFK